MILLRHVQDNLALLYSDCHSIMRFGYFSGWQTLKDVGINFKHRPLPTPGVSIKACVCLSLCYVVPVGIHRDFIEIFICLTIHINKGSRV